MSHYTINYQDIQDEAEKSKKAMNDIVDYLGKEKYNELNRDLVLLYKSEPFDHKRLSAWLSFAGIQGYPVTAWFNQIEQEAKS